MVSPSVIDTKTPISVNESDGMHSPFLIASAVTVGVLVRVGVRVNVGEGDLVEVRVGVVVSVGIKVGVGVSVGSRVGEWVREGVFAVRKVGSTSFASLVEPPEQADNIKTTVNKIIFIRLKVPPTGFPKIENQSFQFYQSESNPSSRKLSME